MLNIVQALLGELGYVGYIWRDTGQILLNLFHLPRQFFYRIRRVAANLYKYLGQLEDTGIAEWILNG